MVAIAAVATMFALSSRPKLTATAQAVLDESHQRELAASAASPAPTSSLSAHAEATERLDAALPAAAKACGITLVSGTEIDIRATVDEDGSIERARLTSQPFAGWPMGDCIAQRLAKTKLATHEGGRLPLHARLVAP